MKSVILEIGVESLPARFLLPALRQLERNAAALLEEDRLGYEELKTFGTPMRMSLLITGLQDRSAPETREVTGPPARLLKDESGAFSKQAAGFARSQGVKPQDLETVIIPKKGEFLLARKTLPGEAALKVLQRFLPRLIGSLEFPKGLVWEETRYRFARPIRTLLALCGKRVVSFKIAGVRSSNKVRGLAALGAKPLTVAAPERYVRQLRDRCVIVDLEERRKTLLDTLEAAAKRSRGRLDADSELIEKTLCLCEYPVAVLGHFKEEYLELPQALLTTVLKRQLMFFPILGRSGGLEPDFIGVRDGISEGQKGVQTGYERVLDARFSDARFFFRRDRQTPLARRAESLARVTFQKGLGSMGDKTARVEDLARWISEALLQDREIDVASVKRTAALAYADLVTDVIGEFPELQGTMGGVYARHEGLGEKVALGLSEFHYPVVAKAPLPTSLEGCIVSLAGKLDTVCAMIAAGFKPSGSEDPFALRRLGNGAVRILLEKQMPVSVPAAVDKALGLVKSRGAEKGFDMPAARRDILEFLWQRAETLFLDRGYRIDELRAVRTGGLENIARTFQRLAAVHALRPEPDFVPLAQAFKRASNILRQAKFDADGDVDKSLLADEAERELFGALCRLEGEVSEKVSQGLFEEGLRSLVALKPEVDRFFDKVMVMAEDEKLRRNRLTLLARLVRLFKSVADISHIQN
ncbi:MAG: glycine--tRNA ligase subunit beta [Elusimicrobiota bacterium]